MTDIINSNNVSLGAVQYHSAEVKSANIHAASSAASSSAMPEDATVDKVIDREEVESGVEQVNQVMEAMNKGIRFKVNDETEEMYVEIVNKETGETIRSIPPENIVEFNARFQKALGLIFDSKA